MSKPFDADALAEHRKREQLLIDAEQIVPVEPCRVPAENTVPVKPGYASAARRAGCEDEWSNAMQARYGWD
jgi:hypothetical protein